MGRDELAVRRPLPAYPRMRHGACMTPMADGPLALGSRWHVACRSDEA
jgi:hypothetical protein